MCRRVQNGLYVLLGLGWFGGVDKNVISTLAGAV